jgi:DNA-binding NtrC family response regulator
MRLLTEPGSPVLGGTLLLINAAAMPHDAQDALAIALSSRPTVGGESYGLIATVAAPPKELLEARHLSRALAQFLVPTVVRLPELIERAEDLRGLIMDRLCRSGTRYAGEPLGIEPQAMSLLVDHDWPGNDAELESVVERAAHVARGERVSVADLASVGFVKPAHESEPVAVLPRRRSERPPGAPVLEEVAARPLARRRRRR